jgi:hypothetical protein
MRNNNNILLSSVTTFHLRISCFEQGMKLLELIWKKCLNIKQEIKQITEAIQLDCTLIFLLRIKISN